VTCEGAAIVTAVGQSIAVRARWRQLAGPGALRRRACAPPRGWLSAGPALPTFGGKPARPGPALYAFTL